MSSRKLIDRVSATEKYPSSCDDFQFWLSDDTILSPFDIVRVENKTDDSITYGVVRIFCILQMVRVILAIMCLLTSAMWIQYR